MRATAERLLARERLVDLAVVLGTFGLFLLQFSSNVFGDYGEKVTDPDALGLLLILATTLPLFWRRRFPWTVMLLAGLGNIALVACGYLVHIPVALIVSLYTFATRTEVRFAWRPISLASSLFLAQVMVEFVVIRLSLEDYLIPALLLAGAWFLGERTRSTALRRTEEQASRRREEQLSIAEERTRIARELHDSAGHAINTILVQAGAARVLRERDPEKSQVAIESIESLARETIEDIDRIVGSLRGDGPADLGPLPGIERIPDLIKHQRDAGFQVDFRQANTGGQTPPPAVGRAAYRILQESLTNAARHGEGRCDVSLNLYEDRLELTVNNPAAHSLPSQRFGGGLGLVGMRERAQLLGGSLDAGYDGDTFRVEAELPYDWNEQ